MFGNQTGASIRYISPLKYLLIGQLKDKTKMVISFYTRRFVPTSPRYIGYRIGYRYLHNLIQPVVFDLCQLKSAGNDS